jgi:hypothetical protein
MRNIPDIKRHTILLLSAFIMMAGAICPPILPAAQMTSSQVRTAVETWVRSVTAEARPEAFVSEMEPYQVDGQTAGYIAHLSGGGFCLCGADDLVLPVYYYCPRGTYDPDNSNYQTILREIGARSQALREASLSGNPALFSYQQALRERSAMWAELAAGQVPEQYRRSKSSAKADPDSLIIDFTPRWHQDSPYNDQCPELTPGEEHTKVGAAALAMTQVMYYWQWPSVGEGNSSVNYEYWWNDTWAEWPLGWDPGIPDDPLWENRLEWTVDGGGRVRMRGYWDLSLKDAAKEINEDGAYQHAIDENWKQFTKFTNGHSVDFSAQFYDWSLPQDSHTTIPSPAGDETARLCYHTGVAAENSYGIVSSDAAASDVKYALKDHFRYDDDVKEEGKNIDNLTEEIQYYRPAVFKGDDPADGTHIWIFYGYNRGTDPDRQFLTNLGWGGDNDGWYSCDVIGFVSGQRQVIRIAPQEMVRFVGGTSSGDGTPDHPFLDLDEALTVVPDSVTLIFKAGTTIPSTGGTLILEQPMVLKGKMVLGE